MSPKSSLPGADQLQKRLKNLDFQYLFLAGEEEFRMRRAVRHLEGLLRKECPSLKVKKLFGLELNWETLANHLSALSLFGDINFFWIFEADKLRPTVRDALTAFLENYRGPHFLLFWGEKADVRLKLVQFFLKKNLLFEFKNFSSPQQIAGWLSGYALERERPLPPETAQLLVQKLGDDLSLLAAEVDKLALAYEKLPPKDQLDKLIVSQRRFAPWDLTAALAKKDAGLALSILRSLRQEGTSTGTILYQISEHYSKLLALVFSDGVSERDYQAWGFRGYLHPSILSEARAISKDQLLTTIEEIATAERQTRFEKIPPDLILETLTVRLCNARSD